MTGYRITKVWARQVLDSRGNPTIEAEIHTSSIKASAIAPSGASTGTHEAMELRDGDKRYLGKGVGKAVENVRTLVDKRLRGMDVRRLEDIDMAMIELDGTPNKSNLGGNATTAVSFAAARAGAIADDMELHDFLCANSTVLPVPMMNVINGGKHAGGNLRPQEFMISPCGAASFSEALGMGVEVYHHLKAVLKKSFGAGASQCRRRGRLRPSDRHLEGRAGHAVEGHRCGWVRSGQGHLPGPGPSGERVLFQR